MDDGQRQAIHNSPRSHPRQQQRGTGQRGLGLRNRAEGRTRRVNLPPQELRAALRRNAVNELPVTCDHAEYAAQLDWAHRNPWDRLLAAQALLENCALVSLDRVFDATAVDRHW